VLGKKNLFHQSSWVGKNPSMSSDHTSAYIVVVVVVVVDH